MAHVHIVASSQEQIDSIIKHLKPHEIKQLRDQLQNDVNKDFNARNELDQRKPVTARSSFTMAARHNYPREVSNDEAKKAYQTLCQERQGEQAQLIDGGVQPMPVPDMMLGSRYEITIFTPLSAFAVQAALTGGDSPHYVRFGNDSCHVDVYGSFDVAAHEIGQEEFLTELENLIE
jgi:hypothetical protein